MAKTFTAPFAQTPQTGIAVATAAAGSVTTDTPTGTVLLATAGADGAILTRLWAVPRGTVTATGLYLFLRKTTDGASIRQLIDSELMAAYTASTTTARPETQFLNYSESTPLRLAAGDQLYVASAVAFAEGIVFRAEYTDF